MHTLAAAFSSAATWLRAHKGVVLGVLVIGAIMMTTTAHAATDDSLTGEEAVGTSDTSEDPGTSDTSDAAPTPGTATESSGRSTLSALLDSTLIVVMLANLITHLSSAVASLTITLIDAILVPILRYNGFATSTIVDTGWSLVRDTVNMFVVVILLVIAVLTIVGSSKANWQQQIPRLFLFTIAVNFSRTICGIFIDISNVVMFQFVNAIVSVGAGNMAQLLMLPSFGDYSEIAATTGPIEAWQHFGSAYLQLALMLAVLGVILIMTLVYLYRIVVLWILIIMSPLAFFAGGIKDIVGAAGGMYGDWTKRFTAALFLGPVLTFFLWLALSVSSSGTIIDNENFPTGDGTTSFGLVLKVFEMSNITSLLLGLVLLVVGMQQAGRFAGDLGGFAGQWINEGMGMNLVKRALKLPGGAGYLAGREVARQTDRWGGRFLDTETNHRGSLMSHAGARLMGVGEAMRTSRIPGMSLAGRMSSSLGDRATRLGEAGLHEAQHHAEDRVKNWSDDRKQSELRIAAAQIARGQTPPMWRNADARNVVLKSLATTRSLQREMENEDGFDELMRQDIVAVRAQRDHLLTTPAERDAFNATQSRYVDLMAPGDIDGFVDSTDFNPRLMRAAALEGANAAQVQAALQRKVVRRTDNGEEITAWDEAMSGTYGNDIRAAAQAYGMPVINNQGLVAQPAPGPGLPPPPAPPVYAVDQIEANIRGGSLRVDTLTAADFAGPNGANLAQALLNLERDPEAVRDPAAQAEFVTRATALADAGVTNVGQRARVDIFNLENPAHAPAGHANAEQVFENRAAPGTYDVVRIGDTIHENAMAMRHLAAALASPQRDQVADAVSANISVQSIQRLGDQLRNANAAQRIQIQQAMTGIVDSLRNHMARNAPPPPPPGAPPGTQQATWEQFNRQLADLYAQARATSRRAGNLDPGNPP